MTTTLARSASAARGELFSTICPHALHRNGPFQRNWWKKGWSASTISSTLVLAVRTHIERNAHIELLTERVRPPQTGCNGEPYEVAHSSPTWHPLLFHLCISCRVSC